MNDNEIHTLMISREEIDQPKELHQFDRFELKRLNNQESLMVLLASQKRLFIKFSKFKEEALLNCATIQRSQGNPKKLYQFRMNFLKQDLEASFVDESQALLMTSENFDNKTMMNDSISEIGIPSMV